MTNDQTVFLLVIGIWSLVIHSTCSLTFLPSPLLPPLPSPPRDLRRIPPHAIPHLTPHPRRRLNPRPIHPRERQARPVIDHSAAPRAPLQIRRHIIRRRVIHRQFLRPDGI